MTTNKQDELAETISRLVIENKNDLDSESVDLRGMAHDVQTLINSEVLSVLEELEKKSEQFATSVDDETLEYESQDFVPLSAIQTLKEQYR